MVPFLPVPAIWHSHARNYLGAVRNWAALLQVTNTPLGLSINTQSRWIIHRQNYLKFLRCVAQYIACGLDPGLPYLCRAMIGHTV